MCSINVEGSFRQPLSFQACSIVDVQNNFLIEFRVLSSFSCQSECVSQYDGEGLPGMWGM